MDPLTQIETRARAIAAQHGTWPCHKGCDYCCRHLAAIPQLTRGEWDLMRDAVHNLPSEVHERIRALKPDRPVTCSLLHPTTGACLIYHHRPIACRAYGFYVERDKGLYCETIQQEVDQGTCADIVWGNWDSIAPTGESHDLVTWFLE